MTLKTHNLSSKSEAFITKENQYGAHNYHPLPVVLERGEGVCVWDVDGKKYFDFLSAYSAVNQGHCHPKIVGAMVKQAQTLTLTSRAFYNDQLGHYEEYVTKYFGFDKVLPMNTGAEAVETALKLCRKWAYEVKGIPENQAQIIVCENNFHGRTTTIISFSNDETARKSFGPFTAGFIKIPYDDVEALENVLKSTPNIAGFLVEPIQGEAGVYVPTEGYLAKTKALCEAHNVLFIFDEVQTGIGLTGKMWAFEHFSAKPDIISFGKKAQVCGVLANKEKFDEIPNNVFRESSRINSTFGGNFIDILRFQLILEVIEKENLVENARVVGEFLLQGLQNLAQKYPTKISNPRGRGLMCAMDLPSGAERDQLQSLLYDEQVIILSCGNQSIRFRPHLNVSTDEIQQALDKIEVCLAKM